VEEQTLRLPHRPALDDQGCIAVADRQAEISRERESYTSVAKVQARAVLRPEKAAKVSGKS
jgi:hypothetical protein